MKALHSTLGRSVMVVLAAILVSGCRPTYVAESSGPAFVQQGEDIRHAASGMIFPSSVSQFQRVLPTVFDSADLDVGVGYYLLPPNKPVSGSVFIYPPPSLISIGSPDSVVESARATLTKAEFERRARSVTDSNSDAVLAEQDRATLVQNNRTRLTGWRGVWNYSTRFANRLQDVQSELAVFCFVDQKQWCLEYRFTWPRGVTPRAEIDRFMQALQIPDLR